MAQNSSSLRASETTLVIQGSIEDLNPQQVLARDLLVEKGVFDRHVATETVKRIGGERSAALKRLLMRSDFNQEDLSGALT
jgi:hypothetical protein